MIKLRGAGQLTDMGSASFAIAARADDAEVVAREPSPAELNERLRGLIDQHYDFIWRCLRRFGLDPPAADDAAQQVFVVAARKISGVAGGAERPYLFGIAQRVASDARRGAQRRREHLREELVETIDPSPLVDEVLDQQRARRMLDEALDELPLELRTVFALHELEDMSMSDIAVTVGIPPGTVASRLRRARQEFEIIVARLGRRGHR